MRVSSNLASNALLLVLVVAVLAAVRLTCNGTGGHLVADFDHGDISSAFGTRWVALTDSVVGGNSIARASHSPHGARQSGGCTHTASEIAITSGAVFS